MAFDPPPERAVTQRDIARALGVSNATVSLALRDSELISDALRERVREVARGMGYRPNPAGAELSRFKSNSTILPTRAALAWINAWKPAEKLRSFKQFDHYWEGAHEAAMKLGYHLEEFRYGGNETAARLHRILDARGIRGILLPPQAPHPDWQDFPWERYSVVRFGRSLKHPTCHVVSSDHVANAILAFARMRARGYRRIGFVTNEDANAKRGGHLHEAGFLMAQRLVPARERIAICLVGELSNTGRARVVSEWVRKNRVDAIFTDVSQCPEILAKARIAAPDDVGFSCANVIDIKVPAGIDQHPAEIGRVGLLMLHSLITDAARGIPPIARQLLVEGSWVDGDTLPDRAVSGRASGSDSSNP